MSASAAPANPDLPISVIGNTAEIPVNLEISYGSSLPGTEKEGETLIDEAGPSRASGGEHIVIRFRTPKTLSSIKLTAFSKSGRGRVLVRKAVAGNALVPDLFEYRAGGDVLVENHRGLNMLRAGGAVEANLARAVDLLDLNVEGYDHNDATVMIQLESADGFAFEDFVITRTRNGGEFGGFFDEEAYKSFSRRDVARLMENSSTPAIADLDQKTFVCSSYSGDRNGEKNFDFKTRRFFSPSPTVLQSSTDLQSRIATWILTQQGWKLPLEPLQTNCGDLRLFYVLRFTPAGNTVSETAISASEARRKCRAAGFAREAINQWLGGFSRSAVDRDYAVATFEFCRAASL